MVAKHMLKFCGVVALACVGLYGHYAIATDDDDRGESNSSVKEFELQVSSLESVAAIPINIHRHPALDYLGISSYGLRRVKHIDGVHSRGAGSIPLDHMFAYIHETLPAVPEDSWGGWTNKQFALTLIENVKIDLWVKTVFEDTLVQQRGLPLDDGYTSPNVNWPDNLTLGLEIVFVDPSDGEQVASEELEAQLTRVREEQHDFIETYRYADPADLYETISSAVNAVSLESETLRSDHKELVKNLKQIVDYKYIDGFTPEMYTSSNRSERSGDDLFYVVKIGEFPVDMGAQSVNIRGGLSEDDLADVNATSFVRFLEAEH